MSQKKEIKIEVPSTFFAGLAQKAINQAFVLKSDDQAATLEPVLAAYQKSPENATSYTVKVKAPGNRKTLAFSLAHIDTVTRGYKLVIELARGRTCLFTSAGPSYRLKLTQHESTADTES
jgi:hypothetical protein